MELVECINDTGYHELAFKFIKNFPIKGDIYEVRKRQHTLNGLGYLLMEIENPIMSNNKEPSFSAKRFRPVDSSDNLIKEITEQLEYTI